MELEDLIDFKTKEEIEKEKRDYEGRIFPLGTAEKELISKRISELFHNGMLSDNDLLFNFICLKQAYLINDEDNKKTEYDKWYKSVYSSYMNEKEKALMIALVNTDMNCTDINDFPDNETIIKEAQNTVLIKPEKKKGFLSFLKK
ncbi:MAG: hypothetical protein Q4D13_05885 [Erysipelotrichaceae bacterium]|nr:hypothetical protein [Erysipelotrichaceae bacterium]